MENTKCVFCSKNVDDFNSIDTKGIGSLCYPCYEEHRNKKIEDMKMYPKMSEQDKAREEYDKLDFKKKILAFIAMKERNKATEAVVQYLENKNNFKSIRSDEKKEIWYYKKGIYVPDGISYIQEECRFILEEAHTTQFSNQVIEKIQADSFIDKEEFFDNQRKDLLPVGNGILNITTRELLPFTPKMYFFTKLDIEYNENAKCPKILKFISEITKSEDDVKVIQELFGFCLLKDYKYEKAFMFYGEHGRNGKSKLLEILKIMINPQNVSGLSLDDIENDQFCLSQLHGKLVNIGGDISNSMIRDASKFKALTGRDLIDADRKFKTRLHFQNYAKMIFACNTLPVPTDDSDAFWYRWVLIEFPYQFLPQKEIDIRNSKHVKLQDQDVVQKLITKSELEGLLIWSLEGLERLQRQNDFSNKESMNEIKYKWKRTANSVAAFIQDTIEYEYGKYITKSEFRQRYNEYCIKKNIKQLSDKVIGISLQNDLGVSGDVVYQRQTDGQNKKLYTWENIKFKDTRDKDDILSGMDGRDIPLEELYNNIVKSGIPEDKVDSRIKLLMINGEIAEVRKNVYRVM